MARDPRIRAIEVEANRRAGADGKNSHAERFGIRNQLRAEQGFGAEKRKRGGVAGTWDRNKKVIKPIATAAGFMFGGPAGSAAVNGAISGFDRPGQGGIGFDVKQGAIGAAKGYAGGQLAQYAGIQGGGGMDSLKGMFSHPIQSAGRGLRTVAQAGKDIGSIGLNSARIGARAVGNAATGVGQWAMKDPKNLLALGQTAIGGLNAYGQAQENNQLNRQSEQIDQRMALEERESAERERIRALLMPYFTSALGGQ